MTAPANAADAPSTFAALQAAVTADDNVRLGGDITAAHEERLVVPTTHPVTLDLAGHSLTITQVEDTALAAVLVAPGADLTIAGTDGGSLDVRGGPYSAGIGGDNGGRAGSVTVTGGTVTAQGGVVGAGIGGGANGAGGTLTVSGGTVTATGGQIGAGVGGGNHAPGGTVTVTGGVLTATGGDHGAGIGGGYNGSGGSLVIGPDGSVTALNGPGASAVGQGAYDPGFGSLSNAGSLTIPAAATLTVLGGVPVQNSGTLHLRGALTGTGTVHNTGTILPGETSTAGTVADVGTGPAGSKLLVSLHNYAVRYDVNGATSAPPPPVRLFAGSFRAARTTLPSGPTPASHRHFVGWFTAASGGSQVTSSTDLSTFADPGPSALILHAHDAIDTYTVSFDAAGGSPAPGDQAVGFGGHATAPPPPSKSGFTFIGWYTAAGERFDFATATVTADLALTAHYTPVVREVTGVGSPARTGADPAQVVAVGVLLLVAGAGALFAGARRRPRRHTT